MKKGVCVVVGAQYGFEGKGLIVQALAEEYGAHVRAGGGLDECSRIHHNGKELELMFLPVGFQNVSANLYVGPGTALTLERLLSEVSSADNGKDGLDISSRLIVDRRSQMFAELDGAPDWLNTSDDVGLMMADEPSVLVQGCGGYGNSIVHHRTEDSDLTTSTTGSTLDECGLPISRVDRVILATRMFPVRAGQREDSLPKSTTWARVSHQAHAFIMMKAPSGAVLQVGRIDLDQVAEAARVQAATEIAVTDLHLSYPDVSKCDIWEDLPVLVTDFLSALEDRIETAVTLVGVSNTVKGGWRCLQKKAH